MLRFNPVCFYYISAIVGSNLCTISGNIERFYPILGISFLNMNIVSEREMAGWLCRINSIEPSNQLDEISEIIGN